MSCGCFVRVGEYGGLVMDTVEVLIVVLVGDDVMLEIEVEDAGE